QSGDQTVHNCLERFLGYRREARRLHLSDHRRPPYGPLIVAHLCAWLSPRIPLLSILLYAYCSLFPGNILCHGHNTFSASPYDGCNTSRRACTIPPEILRDTNGYSFEGLYRGSRKFASGSLLSVRRYQPTPDALAKHPCPSGRKWPIRRSRF